MEQTLKTGDVLHCAGKRLISKLIRWATKSKFNHTALFIEIWGQPYIIDAQENGVNVKTFEQWVKEYDYKYIVTRPPFEIDTKELSLKAMSKVGTTAYDFEGLLIKQPVELITGKWKKKKGTREQNKMYCSEYVAWVYNIEESYRTSPADFLEYCKNNKWSFIYNSGIDYNYQ